MVQGVEEIGAVGYSRPIDSSVDALGMVLAVRVHEGSEAEARRAGV